MMTIQFNWGQWLLCGQWLIDWLFIDYCYSIPIHCYSIVDLNSMIIQWYSIQCVQWPNSSDDVWPANDWFNVWPFNYSMTIIIVLMTNWWPMTIIDLQFNDPMCVAQPASHLFWLFQYSIIQLTDIVDSDYSLFHYYCYWYSQFHSHYSTQLFSVCVGILLMTNYSHSVLIYSHSLLFNQWWLFIDDIHCYSNSVTIQLCNDLLLIYSFDDCWFIPVICWFIHWLYSIVIQFIHWLFIPNSIVQWSMILMILILFNY